MHNANRDRGAAYDFSNNDYITKRPKYVPDTTPGAEEDMFERVFHPVPAGWNTDVPPSDNPEKKPSAWVLTVMGDVPGIKKQEATALAFTEQLKELADKYREVKEHFFMVRQTTTLRHG